MSRPAERGGQPRATKTSERRTSIVTQRGLLDLQSALLIVLAVLVAYHATFTVPFLFDDASILDTESLHELSWQTVRGTTRPLVQLSLALNWAVGGARVVGYHAVNFVVHVLAALTLYGIAARTLGTTGPALAIALVWAVHPLATESVTYVVQRAESLMALCYLLTLYAVIRGAARAARRRGTLRRSPRARSACSASR